MSDQIRPPSTQESNTNKVASKILTALGHSCGLAAFLGIFIALSAYSSDPNSGMLRIGIIVTLVGVAGFIAAQWVGKRRR